ncbi:OmpA family protein [Actinomadura macrotermitis]|uniref:OmpA-like domain-containing protein n=1 Tax=Actinomadura macrotermitis TaxID=2585200 RepID=A0A7K0BSH4_9ACTN|nr:OmpA family protein [Actinomadura macrotermitis]MQY03832.1 hypothetical protein [Actinomadura macrotermitis]
MSRPHRAAIAAAAFALALGVPGLAAADPDVPDPNLAQAVHDINATGAVTDLNTAASITDLDLQHAVVPLETEEKNGEQVTLHLSADVLFDFDKATLTDAARRRIAELAPKLRSATGAVQISGHSDSVGAPAYNLQLSRRRAEAVKAELQRALTGTNLTFTAEGYGETRPVAPNKNGDKDDPDGRAKNRRVDITYQQG